MKHLKVLNVKELDANESILYSGGKAAELVGLGLASAVLAGYAGVYGAVYAYYNFFKD